MTFGPHFNFESFKNFNVDGVILGNGRMSDSDIIWAHLQVLRDGPLVTGEGPLLDGMDRRTKEPSLEKIANFINYKNTTKMTLYLMIILNYY